MTATSVLDRYLEATVADSTRLAYEKDLRYWSEWCAGQGVDPDEAGGRLVAVWFATLADDGISWLTLRRRLSAISWHRRSLGLEDPASDPLLKKVCAGIRRRIGTRPESPARALSVDELRRMVEACPDSIDGIRDAALLVVGFLGGFRRSEIASMRLEDVENGPKGLLVLLSTSKTDAEGAGRTVAIPRQGDERLCPSHCVSRWISESGITDGFLFRSVNRWGHVGDGLKGLAVARIVQRAAARIGLDMGGVSGHSLRAGLATAASVAGADERSIMEQTGHRNIEVVRSYVRRADPWRGNAAANLFPAEP